MPKHLSQFTDEEWKAEVEQAKNIWNSLPYHKNPRYEMESANWTMHPGMFYELSNVAGFNEKNGWTYREYVDNWKRR